MWIQVRSMDGKTSHRIDGLSKLTKIEDLREKLEELHKIIYGKVDITRENYLQENDRRTRGSTRRGLSTKICAIPTSQKQSGTGTNYR